MLPTVLMMKFIRFSEGKKKFILFEFSLLWRFSAFFKMFEIWDLTLIVDEIIEMFKVSGWANCLLKNFLTMIIQSENKKKHFN